MSSDEWKILREVLIQILKNQRALMLKFDPTYCNIELIDTEDVLNDLLGDSSE